VTERRLIALDELRGLAITAVIISHVALVYRDDSMIAFGLAMPALGVGVDLFFVISGFLIFENATRMIARAPQSSWRGAAAFWIRRAIRIALPAWATVAAIAALQGASGADGASLGDLAVAAGFYADFHWGNCWAGVASCGDSLVASHFWSLALEITAVRLKSIWPRATYCDLDMFWQF
jgi:peptidoglycan/LPS O-acetylase OafA/YrhL